MAVRIVAPQGVPHTADPLAIEALVTEVPGTVFQDTEVREVDPQQAGLQDSAGVLAAHRGAQVTEAQEVVQEAQGSAEVQVVVLADLVCAVPVVLHDPQVEAVVVEAVAVAEEDVNHPIILIP